MVVVVVALLCVRKPVRTGQEELQRGVYISQTGSYCRIGMGHRGGGGTLEQKLKQQGLQREGTFTEATAFLPEQTFSCKARGIPTI